MLIFIIGYMGSGKTTFGEKLARELGYGFTDLDREISSIVGCSIVEYFGREGESAFREKERQALVQLLRIEDDMVIATGGGTPCYSDNMDLMNNAGFTVFLDVPVDVLYERLAVERQERPLLKQVPPDKLKDFIWDHLQSRMIYYSKAQFRITGDEDISGSFR